MIVYAAVITASNVERQRYFFNTREEAEKECAYLCAEVDRLDERMTDSDCRVAEETGYRNLVNPTVEQCNAYWIACNEAIQNSFIPEAVSKLNLTIADIFYGDVNVAVVEYTLTTDNKLVRVAA